MPGTVPAIRAHDTPPPQQLPPLSEEEVPRRPEAAARAAHGAPERPTPDLAPSPSSPPTPRGYATTVSKNVSEKEAREVAEAARETEWSKPSFGKELFLGRFRLDLIHPQPKLDPQAVEKGERFLADLKQLLTSECDPLEIERTAKIPDHVIDGLKRLGALGMKVPEEYGGLGLSQVYYNRALALAGTWHASISTLLSAHQSIGVAEPL